MIHEQPTDDTRERAALYALGALGGAEAQSFEHHLREGCRACRAEMDGFLETVGRLGFSADAVPPAASLRSEMLARVRTAANVAESGSGDAAPTASVPDFRLVRSDEDTWQEVAPGLRAKFLYANPQGGRATVLVRMAPGVEYPPHRHVEPEEFFVLEGGCIINGQELREGDYYRAETGTVHTETRTVDGCLVLVIFSPQNEMISDADQE